MTILEHTDGSQATGSFCDSDNGLSRTEDVPILEANSPDNFVPQPSTSSSVPLTSPSSTTSPSTHKDDLANPTASLLPTQSENGSTGPTETKTTQDEMLNEIILNEIIESCTKATPTNMPATGPAEPSPQIDDDDGESFYHIKWIEWNNDKIPIITQSVNGPCPLIAIMNVLLLREKVKLPKMLGVTTSTQLLTYLVDCLMDSVPNVEGDDNAMLNLEQNVHDAMEILPKLKTGLDVNIRFTGITDFEYTRECILFDLLRISLYHGWLIDPSSQESVISNQSYNQLVYSVIENEGSEDPEIMARSVVAREFLEKTASQLTLYGLNQLKTEIKDNELGILFRNNHFLTLFKRDGELYTLVTDHGYLSEMRVVWESLDNIEGAGRFFGSNFDSLDERTNRNDKLLARPSTTSGGTFEALLDDYFGDLTIEQQTQTPASEFLPSSSKNGENVGPNIGSVHGSETSQLIVQNYKENQSNVTNSQPLAISTEQIQQGQNVQSKNYPMPEVSSEEQVVRPSAPIGAHNQQPTRSASNTSRNQRAGMGASSSSSTHYHQSVKHSKESNSCTIS